MSITATNFNNNDINNIENLLSSKNAQAINEWIKKCSEIITNKVQDLVSNWNNLVNIFNIDTEDTKIYKKLLKAWYAKLIQVKMQQRDYFWVIEIYEKLLNSEINIQRNNYLQNKKVNEKVSPRLIININTINSENGLFYKKHLENTYRLYMKSLKNNPEEAKIFANKKLNNELNRVLEFDKDITLDDLNTKIAIFWKNQLSLID